MNSSYAKIKSVSRLISKSFIACVALILFSQLSLAGQVTASVWEKESPRDQQPLLSVHFEKESLPDVLQELARKVKVGISFETETVPSKRVTYQAENRSIFRILGDILEGTGLQAALSKNQKVILIKKKTLQEQIVLQTTITGTVTDAQTGETLPGVNILVKGTSTGASTDANGQYELEVESLQDTLVVSFVGYKTKEVPINGRTEIDVNLQTQAISGEEMVVVGYGTQRKSNLTGSVSSVDMDEFEKKTVTQSSQALAGAIPGVTVRQGSGQPGKTQASISIRGQGTFSRAGNSPLVIIDGMPGNINDVDPNDIEDISVLKDAASAAIYGSRAANGVVLVTTKEGQKGELKVNYHAYIGKQEPTELPQFVDSWTYAEMLNEARSNAGLGQVYSQDDIQKYKSENYPDKYPNKHHIRDLFNSGNGIEQKHNLTFSGGTESTQYLFSMGYTNENGLIERTDNKRYNFRLNLNSKLKRNLNLDIKLFGDYNNQKEPAMIISPGTEVEGLEAIGRVATRFNATIPGKKSDGSYGVAFGEASPEAGLDQESSIKRAKDMNFMGNASLSWNIIKPLKLTGHLSFKNEENRTNIFGASFEAGGITFGPSQTNITPSNEQTLQLEAIIEYEKKFGSHNFDILGGVSQLENKNEWTTSYGEQFPSNKVHVLNAASKSNQTVGGNVTSWKLRSFFGRINYSFQEKYILNSNFRYDGSSRFAKGNRYAFFPSFSAAWRISEEFFFQVPWISDLKVRGSYGNLGNQEIGLYPYQKTYSTAQDYIFGGEAQSGVRLLQLPFKNISWETTRVIDGGIDIGLFNNRVNLTVDYYHKKTSDILYNLSVSNILGMGVGSQNGGSVLNKGWEFNLKYKNNSGDFSYSISPNFSIVHNEIISLAGVKRDVGKGLFVGQPISSIYGYKTDGLFVDQQDVKNYAEQNYSAKPGLPRYKDISGPGGESDGKVSADYDRTVIGNEFPKYSYGLNITANYKGFDFFAQLQGQGGYQKKLSGFQLPLYNQQGDIQKWHVNNRWTEEQPDRHAKYPRMQGWYQEPPWNSNLEYWLRDGTFLRLKNVQLGYSISSKLLSNSFMERLRVYVSGRNIKTFDRFMPGWDPEMENTGFKNSGYYPPTRLWNLGVKIQF